MTICLNRISYSYNNYDLLKIFVPYFKLEFCYFLIISD